jgi:hypothetical protein
LSIQGYFNTTSPVMVQIADMEADRFGAGNNEFFTDGYYDCVLRTPTQLQTWTNRIFQIPGITESNGNTLFYLPPGTSGASSYVTGLSSAYSIVTEAVFDSTFY